MQNLFSCVYLLEHPTSEQRGYLTCGGPFTHSSGTMLTHNYVLLSHIFLEGCLSIIYRRGNLKFSSSAVCI